MNKNIIGREFAIAQGLDWNALTNQQQLAYTRAGVALYERVMEWAILLVCADIHLLHYPDPRTADGVIREAIECLKSEIHGD